VNSKFSANFARASRVWDAIPLTDLLTVIIIIISIITIGAILISGSGSTAPQAHSSLLIAFIIACSTGVILLGVLILKTSGNYRKTTYDYTFAFVLDEWFEKLKPSRLEAVEACKKYLNLNSQKNEVEKWGEIAVEERAKVEPVLDFFEDLGFYLHGCQISDEVAHHHYHHWLRGYYSVLKSYIKFYQENDEKGDASAYIWIGPLFERLSEIEKKRPMPKLILKSYEDKMDFLNEEPS
jgi:hypothetical protein